MKITKSTIIRTIMLGIVIINMILKACGLDVINADESVIASAVETVVQIGAIIAAWWYNNSFTEKAKKADIFMKQLSESEDETDK